MQIPGAPAVFFLAYILVFMPWMAFRTAARLRAVRDAGGAFGLPTRDGIWLGTLAGQVVLLVLALLTGRGFGYDMFAMRASGPREILAATAALLCATAFAPAHSLQGWKSSVVIFVMALTMHGLVWLTGTLVLAILVHVLYDFAAGYLISRDADRFWREAAGALPAPES